MAYSKIHPSKLSDVREQQLEYLIPEWTLCPGEKGEKLPPESDLCWQGGGTFVQSNIWQSVKDRLTELLGKYPESQ